MERFAVTPCNDSKISKCVGVVLKGTVGFNSTFRSVCSDCRLQRTVGFNSTFRSVCSDRRLQRTVGFNSTFRSVYSDCLLTKNVCFDLTFRSVYSDRFLEKAMQIKQLLIVKSILVIRLHFGVGQGGPRQNGCAFTAPPLPTSS